MSKKFEPQQLCSEPCEPVSCSHETSGVNRYPPLLCESSHCEVLSAVWLSGRATCWLTCCAESNESAHPNAIVSFALTLQALLQIRRMRSSWLSIRQSRAATLRGFEIRRHFQARSVSYELIHWQSRLAATECLFSFQLWSSIVSSIGVAPGIPLGSG